MPKSARRYDLYLPLTHNDGRPIPDEQFRAVQGRLLARFGGLTALQRDFPLEGIWQGEARLYLDQVISLSALDFRRQGEYPLHRRTKTRPAARIRSIGNPHHRAAVARPLARFNLEWLSGGKDALGPPE
jgi:hypothetical protein